jgi:hypothetical protein
MRSPYELLLPKENEMDKSSDFRSWIDLRFLGQLSKLLPDFGIEIALQIMSRNVAQRREPFDLFQTENKWPPGHFVTSKNFL